MKNLFILISFVLVTSTSAYAAKSIHVKNSRVSYQVIEKDINGIGVKNPKVKVGTSYYPLRADTPTFDSNQVTINAFCKELGYSKGIEISYEEKRGSYIIYRGGLWKTMHIGGSDKMVEMSCYN